MPPCLRRRRGATRERFGLVLAHSHVVLWRMHAFFWGREGRGGGERVSWVVLLYC